MEENIIEITNANINDYINNDKIFILDFFSNSCSPCKLLFSVLKEIKEKFSDKINIGKLNVEDSLGLIMEYNISNIPTLIFFKNGQMKKRLVGLNNKKMIIEIIENILEEKEN